MSEVAKVEKPTPTLLCRYCFGGDEGPLRQQPVNVIEIFTSAGSKLCIGCSLFQQLIDQAEKAIQRKVREIRFRHAESLPLPSRILLTQEDGKLCEMTFGIDSDNDNVHELEALWVNLGVWNPRSSQLCTLAQRWIKNCLSWHPLCHRPDATPPLPRRVIDVGHREAFLYETRGETGQYATLSHCWKDSQPLKTTKSTIKSRLGRLIWSQLPTAFQECIELVRSLGIRYVWIDSLCIVQDDEKEWEVEAARMASIFENSYLTIAMHQPEPNASSIHSSDGITGSISIDIPTIAMGSLPVVAPELARAVMPSGTRKFQYRIRSMSLESLHDIERDQLSKRGWCFQERLLANRILHLTPTELLFECSENRLCECSEHYIPPNQEQHFSSTNWKAIFVKDSVTNHEWQDMITMYTRKDLTYHKDTLPALSGIANRLRNGGCYYAGMWEEHLRDNLLWYSLATKKRWPMRPKSYIAPSFAWSSAIGSKAFLDCSVLDAKFKIVSVSCTATGDNPLGELKGGFIQLEAAVLKAKFVNSFNESIPASAFLADDRSGGRCPWATLVCKTAGHQIFHPDTDDGRHLSAGTNLWCVQLFVTRKSTPRSYGLVLRQARSDEASLSPKSPRYLPSSSSKSPGYVRVGIFGSIKSSYFTDAEVQKFDIL